jgi:hypothetical protein
LLTYVACLQKTDPRNVSEPVSCINIDCSLFSSLSTAVIAGISTGSTVAVLAVILAILFFVRSRKLRQEDIEKEEAPPAFSGNISLPPSTAFTQADSSTSRPQYMRPSNGFYVQNAASDDNTSQPSESINLPNPYGSEAGSVSVSTHYLAKGGIVQLLLRLSQDYAEPRPFASTSMPYRGGYSIEPLPPRPPPKSFSRLPRSATQSLNHISQDELRTSRMVVEGRSQDFGHVPVPELPPDYSQATQQFLPRTPGN